MKRLITLLLATLSLVTSALPKVGVYDFADHGVKVEFKPLATNAPTFGYYPALVTIENLAPEPKTVRLWCESTSTEKSGWRKERDLSVESDFTLEVAPIQTQTYSILIPVARGQESIYRKGTPFINLASDINLTWSIGNELKQGSYESQGLAADLNILFSEGVNPVGRKATDFLEEREFLVAQFPTSLKAIRGYGVIVTTIADLQRFTKPQRSNLSSWLGQGGALVVQSDTKALASEVATVNRLLPGTRFDTNKLGTHKLGHITFATSQQISGNVGQITKWMKGKPRPADSEFTDHAFDLTSHIREDFSAKRWNLARQMGSKNFGGALLAFFVIIFVVLVGPLNFFVFASQGQRHRLFITTPIIAAAGSLLLLLFILISEGTGGRGGRLVHMELDPARDQAYITQQQLCRTGVLFNTTFQLDEDYEIYQIPLSQSRWARVIADGEGVDETYTLSPQPDGTIRHQGNFFSSRSESGHLIIGHKVTKEDIHIDRDGDSLTLTSSFAHPIHQLYLRDGEKYYTVTDLISGTPQRAHEITDAEYRTHTSKIEQMFNGKYQTRIHALSQRPQSYIALTDTLGGIDTLSSIDWKRSDTIITGTFTPSTH